MPEDTNQNKFDYLFKRENPFYKNLTKLLLQCGLIKKWHHHCENYEKVKVEIKNHRKFKELSKILIEKSIEYAKLTDKENDS